MSFAAEHNIPHLDDNGIVTILKSVWPRSAGQWPLRREVHRIGIQMTSNSQVHKGKAKAFEFFRPKPDGDIDPAGEAGWFLQRERERRGERLEQASRAWRIHPHHLDAIETGDLTRLPNRREALR